MRQYFNLVTSDDPMAEDDMYVLTTNENIYIQVTPYDVPSSQFFVWNEFTEVGSTATLYDAMVMAIAAQVLVEFNAEFLSAAVE